MSALSLLIVVAALGVIAWTILTGQVGEQGLDALFLIMVCLLVAAGFGLVPFFAWRKGLLPQLRRKRSEPEASPERKPAEASNVSQEHEMKGRTARGVSNARVLLLMLLASFSAAIPLMVWHETWFGRKLSDAQMTEYLQETRRPRRIQHALVQISERISEGDENAKRWYPNVVELAKNPEPKIRNTAAWVMGQDNRSEEFHRTLASMLSDPEPVVRRNAALSLVRFQDASGRWELVGILRPYGIRSPEAGRIEMVAESGQNLGTQALAARIRRDDGNAAEVRTPFAGSIEALAVRAGDHVVAGSELLTLAAGPDQVWEALRGLYLVGQPEDLPAVDRWSGGSDRIGRQAALTAQAIRTRAERTSSR
jgi:hypothetical protein